MNHKVQSAPGFFDFTEDSVETCGICHIAWQHKAGANPLREWNNALLQCVALVSERNFRPLVVAGFANTPGNRAIIRDAHNEPAFSRHQISTFTHLSPRHPCVLPASYIFASEGLGWRQNWCNHPYTRFVTFCFEIAKLFCSDLLSIRP